MEKRHQIRERKRSLHSLIRVHKSIEKLSQILSSDCKEDECLEPDILERAATEFNQLTFHASRCKSEISNNHEKVDFSIDFSIEAFCKFYIDRLIFRKSRNSMKL